MDNPNLVDLLGRRTRRKVGLAAFPAARVGAVLKLAYPTGGNLE